jgi:hypothetical protein
MKKFYIPIFAVGLLLCSFLSQAQTTYNSIADGNPSNYTLDDARFWIGGTPPPAHCINCDIRIWSPVVVPHNGMSSTGINGPWLDHDTLDNSIMRLQANMQIDTYISLRNGSQVFVGTDPSYHVTVFLNDQVDMDATSSVRIGNINSYIDANNTIMNTPIKGTIPDFANGGIPDAGIYSLIPTDGENYTLVLNSNGIGTAVNAFNQYNLNCTGGPGFCAAGIVIGPAITGPTPGSPPPINYGIIFGGSITLPVDLVQFYASKNDDGSVKLSWSTSQEVNAGYFDIERSGDQTAWTKLGSVNAKGNSSTTTDYQFSDRLPLDGTGYYRLKMVDLDAKYKYSKTIAVTNVTDARPLVIYNNPFTDMIRLKVNVSRAQNLTMTVTDMLGKTYINQNYHALSGDNMVNLPSSITSHGMYILRIHGESYDQTVKLERQ